MLKGKPVLRRISLVGGLAALLLLVFGFSQRMAEFTRLNNQLDREGARITELVGTQDYLQDQIAYATSQAAVEEWAREEARMAQPGDFAVIPLAPPGATPQAPEAAAPTLAPMSNWQVWLEWFFYAGP